MSSAGNGEFNEVIVALIRQIRAPKEKDADPLTDREESCKEFFPLDSRKGAVIEHFAGKDVFILVEQSKPDDWKSGFSKTKPQHLAICTLVCTQQCTNKNAGIDDNPGFHWS